MEAAERGSVRSNIFIDHFDRLAVGHKENAILEVVLENLKMISLNALSVGSICLYDLDRVVDFDLDLTTLKFIPPSSNPFYNYTPQSVIDFFGGAKRAHHAAYYDDFLTFIAASLPFLAKCKVDGKPFASHFLQNVMQKAEYGLHYLSHFYNLENQKGNEKLVDKAYETLKTVGACFQLIATTETENYFLKRAHAVRILEVEGCSHLKELFHTIIAAYPRKPTYRFPSTQNAIGLLEQKLGPQLCWDFFTTCLQLEKSQVLLLMESLERLFKGEDEAAKSDAFLLYLLNSSCFSSLKDQVIEKILSKKDYGDKEFNARCEGEVVLTAISYIKNKISSIKTGPHAEEALKEYVNKLALWGSLHYYPPFQNIWNFVFHHYDTPKVLGYPGLPMGIGSSSMTKIITNILMLASKPEDADLTTVEGREILLKSCEFLFEKNREGIDKKTLQQWVLFFGEKELEKHPKLQAIIEKELTGELNQLTK